MPSASAAIGGRGQKGGNFPSLLNASNMKGNSVTVLCIGVRPAPENFNAKLILDFVPKSSKNGDVGGIALNKTNTLALIDFGGDDYERWAGHEITFSRCKREFMGKRVDGLEVTKFSGVVAGWKKKAKEYLPDSDVPF